jgi:hypothetical protein
MSKVRDATEKHDLEESTLSAWNLSSLILSELVHHLMICSVADTMSRRR